MEYLLLLIIFGLSAIYLEWRYHIHLYESRKERLIITAVFFVVGFLWDSYAVLRGHWIYGDLIGIKIGLLPLEEYLFFLIIPFWILTVYKVLTKKIK